jgi:hypothetical protein
VEYNVQIITVFENSNFCCINAILVGLATDSIVLEEEIDPNYVPSEEEGRL